MSRKGEKGKRFSTYRVDKVFMGESKKRGITLPYKVPSKKKYMFAYFCTDTTYKILSS